ncbi:helix-turn-helix domain-containing protein [Streptomyces sp. NPDC059398]|uniref:AlbA family DNA-binding domain-containing protein n=1 Tax=Streptomyces sp. NPDC059398 TaxID=3346820 RepID=UPI00369FD1E2
MAVEAVTVHPLLTTPSGNVTLAMVQDFVSLGIPENLTVEYKRGGEKPVDAVAALANSYGGMVLIGVAEDSGTHGVPTGIVGVSRKEKEKLVNQIATTYDPLGRRR